LKFAGLRGAGQRAATARPAFVKTAVLSAAGRDDRRADARANQLWAPFPDNDPEGARRSMQRFMASIASCRAARIAAVESAC